MQIPTGRGTTCTLPACVFTGRRGTDLNLYKNQKQLTRIEYAHRGDLAVHFQNDFIFGKTSVD